MSELGNLEDTLQVHYLSKIDDSVDDILTALRKRGAILMAEAEEVRLLIYLKRVQHVWLKQ